MTTNINLRRINDTAANAYASLADGKLLLCTNDKHEMIWNEGGGAGAGTRYYSDPNRSETDGVNFSYLDKIMGGLECRKSTAQLRLAYSAGVYRDLTVDSSGNLLIDSGNVGLGCTPTVALDISGQFSRIKYAGSVFNETYSYKNTWYNAPSFNGYHSAGALDVLSPSADGYILCSLGGWGVDNEVVPAWKQAASIWLRQDGTLSGANAYVPGRLEFYTGTDSAAVAERMRITSYGYLGLNTTVPACRLNVVEETAGTDDSVEVARFHRATTGMAAVGLANLVDVNIEDDYGVETNAGALYAQLRRLRSQTLGNQNVLGTILGILDVSGVGRVQVASPFRLNDEEEIDLGSVIYGLNNLATGTIFVSIAKTSGSSPSYCAQFMASGQGATHISVSAYSENNIFSTDGTTDTRFHIYWNSTKLTIKNRMGYNYSIYLSFIGIHW